MVTGKGRYQIALLLISIGCFGCAGTGSLVRSPTVDLTHVEVSRMSFTNQTFLLGFNVTNPNPFPIPVKSVRYRVRLNDQNFAGGETQSRFTVPADSDESFVISVDLDLLQSGAQLTSIIRSGVRENVDYELYGDFNVDIPLTPSLKFSNTGTIMLKSELF